MGNHIQSDQIVLDEPKRNIRSTSRQEYDVIMDLVDDTQRYPGRVGHENVSGTDAILRIDPSPVQKIGGLTSDSTSGMDFESLSSLSNQFHQYPLSNLDLFDGSVSGAIDLGTVPTTTAGSYRWMSLSAKSTSGAWEVSFGDESVSSPNFGDAMPPVPSSNSGIVSIRLQNSGGGTWGFGRPDSSDIYNHTRGGGGSGGLETLLAVADANAKTGVQDNTLIYVVATDTVYRYEETEMSSVTVNELFVLSVTSDTNARWRGVAGKYIYENFNQNSYVAKQDIISSAVSGTFDTGHAGNPLISVHFWDDSANEFLVMSPASFDLVINETGTSIEYDFSLTTFDASDFVRLTAVYHDLVATLSNEFDSGWILKSAINDTPSAGSHQLDLPSGFTDVPAGCSILLDTGAGTTAQPGNPGSYLTFDSVSGVQRVAADVGVLGASERFRVFCSMNARPSGVFPLVETLSSNTTETLVTPSGDVMVVAEITGAEEFTLPAASVMNGFRIYFKNPTAFDWDIISSDNIDGVSSMQLDASNFDGTFLISDGSTYHRF